MIRKLKKLYFLWWYGRHLKKRIDKKDTKRGTIQINLESILNNSEKLKNNKLNIKNWHNIKWNSF